ncbi:hypothetical protein BCY76_012090 [Nesterenkonia sp. PF2B19]|nr:hypothetical protein BCY76_012090 [Nesterenkonia sp. PF2B19]
MGLHERGLAESTVSLVEMLDGSETEVHGESGLTVTDCCQEIVRGGFPGLRQRPAHLLGRELDAYLPRVVDRDLPDQGLTARRLSLPVSADLAGKLFEALATLTVRVIAEAHGARVTHRRSHDSCEEVDLIVAGEDARRRRGPGGGDDGETHLSSTRRNRRRPSGSARGLTVRVLRADSRLPEWDLWSA